MKKSVQIVVFLMLSILLCIPAHATSNDSEDGTDSIISEQLEASGANDLNSLLDKDTLDLMEKIGIDTVDVDALVNISPASVLDMILGIFTGSFSEPLSAAAVIIGIILLCAILEGMKTALSENLMNGIFGLVCAGIIGISVVLPIAGCLSHVCSVIDICGKFMLGFIPVLAALMIASGSPLQAGTYNLVVFGAAETLSWFAGSIMQPFMCIYLAFCVVGGITPMMNFTQIAESIKKAVNIFLGFCATIFMGLLTIQGVISAGVDSMGTKTTRFLLTSFVPVLGNALADGLGTVQSCAGLVKNGVGAFGIIAAAVIFLPAIAEVIVWIITLNLCSAASDIFGLKGLTDLLKAISFTLSMLMAIMLFSALMLIVTTAVVITVKGG